MPRSDQLHNLNPHAAARVAMCLYNERYAFKQRGGSMDFWDSLSEGEKRTCAAIACEIRKARPYTGRFAPETSKNAESQ